MLLGRLYLQFLDIHTKRHEYPISIEVTPSATSVETSVLWNDVHIFGMTTMNTLWA